MLVSIIVPNFNRAKYVQDALDSIINQSYKNLEILVVDDASSDDSVEVVEGYARRDGRIKLIKVETNKGAPYCRNLGLSRASGTYLNFFDSDDIMHPEKISSQIRLFDEEENLDVVICQTRFFNEEL